MRQLNTAIEFNSTSKTYVFFYICYDYDTSRLNSSDMHSVGGWSQCLVSSPARHPTLLSATEATGIVKAASFSERDGEKLLFKPRYVYKALKLREKLSLDFREHVFGKLEIASFKNPEFERDRYTYTVRIIAGFSRNGKYTTFSQTYKHPRSSI